MFKKTKKWLCVALTTVMMLTILVFPANADDSTYPFSDISGHWAEQEIKAAATNRHVNGDLWINGYPDRTFRPDAEVTRAEFVKMLLASNYLYSYTDTAKFLHEASSYAKSSQTLTDMDGHWLTKEGWTQTALDFGLIIPSDYPDGAFLPNQPATRIEAAVMIVRMLGLVYPAKNSAEEELSFTDTETIEPALRGYVFQAVEAGVLTGYPDGSFLGDKTITRAEAVSMIFRALAYMEKGIDRDVQAFATEWSPYMPEAQKQKLKIWLTVPAQVIDGTVYLPVRDVVAANAALYHSSVLRSSWDLESQQLGVEYVYEFWNGAGDARYDWFLGDGINKYSLTYHAPSRLLYGELMVPVYTLGASEQAGPWGEALWNADAKTLVIPLREQYVNLS